MKDALTVLGLLVSSCSLNSPDGVRPELTAGGSTGVGGATSGASGTMFTAHAGSPATGGARATSSGGSNSSGSPTGTSAGSGALLQTGGKANAESSSGGTSSGGSGATYACDGAKPSSASITSFTNLSSSFGFQDGVPGGIYSYPPQKLLLTATPEQALNINGTVDDPSGVGLFLNSCTDASAYTGISFSIKGNVGPSNVLDFYVRTNSNTPVDPLSKRGTCAVPVGTSQTLPLCRPSGYSLPVSASGGVVNVEFSSLSGGVPVSAVTGKDIVGLEWAFTWNSSESTSYSVDVTIDDIQFTAGGGNP